MGVSLLFWLSPGLVGAEYESRSLDEVTRSRDRTIRETTSLDDVAHATPRSLDSVPHVESRSLDSVTRQVGGATGSGRDARAEAWSPTACDAFPMTPLADREPVNRGEWKALVARWHGRLVDSRGLLEQASAAYEASLRAGAHLRSSRGTLVRKRDQLRRAYNEALCVLPRALEAAREAGVEPEALRAYE